MTFPHRRFPVEMLAKVFQHACLDDGPVEIEESAMPLSLSRVSRSWRDLALDTPELWSSLHIESASASPLFVDKLTTWFGKSRNRPLTMDIILQGDEDTRREVNVDILTVIFAEFHRWQCVTLTSDAADPGSLLPFHTWCGKEAILLKSLELRTTFERHGEEGDCADLVVSTLLSRAPHLSKFVWDDFGMHRTEEWNPMTLPFASLRELSLSCSMSAEELVALVARCPQLEYANLHADEDRHPRDQRPEVVRHATLRHLVVNQSPTAEESLYRLLDLPKLVVLEVVGLATNLEDVLKFLEHHSFLLELELNVNELEALSSQEFQRLGNTLSSLPKLSLDMNEEVDVSMREDGGVSQLLFDVLNERDAGGRFAFCPNVEEVFLMGIGYDRDALEVIEVVEG